MFANALIVTTCLILAILFFLMDQLKYLIPYRDFLWKQYAWVIVAYSSVLFLNLYAGSYFLIRKFFLKDTGRKLSQVDKQLRIEHARLAQIRDDQGA